MRTGAKQDGFGTKGANRTVAEQLLSGGANKPAPRAPLPRLKPRAKPKFGRKVVMVHSPVLAKRKRITSWIVAGLLIFAGALFAIVS